MTGLFHLQGEGLAKDDLILSRSFYTSAKLKTNIDLVKREINGLKGFKLQEGNTILKYKITNIDSSKDSLLELSGKHICLTFFSESNDNAIYKKNFAVFMTLVSFLKDHYEAHIADIYVYIMNVLNNEWSGVSKDQIQIIECLKERIISLDESNRTLAHAIIESTKTNILISRELSIYEEFSKCIIEHLKSIRKNNSTDCHSIMLALGIDSELIKKLEATIKIRDGRFYD